jgi:hypothetical protein
VTTDAGEGRVGLVSELARHERGELAAVFRELRRSPSDPPREAYSALERSLERILARVDPLPGEEDGPPGAR